jgi:hypothetical protein
MSALIHFALHIFTAFIILRVIAEILSGNE